jgi:hypothetical protein
MATMGEIMRNPSAATKEDVEALGEIMKILREFKQSLMPYEGITLKSGRDIKEISQRIYQENLILSAIMEAFVFKEEYYFKDMNEWVFNYADKEFVWDVSVPYYKMCVAKLCNLKLLEAIYQTEDDKNPLFKITSNGRESLRQQTFANLAQSSLFNYQACNTNEQSVKINSSIRSITWGALIVAVVSAMIALAALFISIM